MDFLTLIYDSVMNKMQAQTQADIQALKEENERLRKRIEENEQRIRSLQLALANEQMPLPPVRILVDKTEAWGEGEPPVPGAIPARTCRDTNGNIHIMLCRTYAGEGWIYTPVADGWITITHESDQ